MILFLQIVSIVLNVLVLVVADHINKEVRELRKDLNRIYLLNNGK